MSRKGLLEEVIDLKICILHCGHPKTGTSSLQQYLAANSAILAAHGICFPVLRRPAERANTVPWAGFQNASAFKALTKGDNLKKFDQLREVIKSQPHDVLLLSAEFLMATLFQHRKSAVWEFLIKNGYRIETISFLRDQPERINSAYAQQCKSARYPKGFDAYAETQVLKTLRVEREPDRDIDESEELDPGRLFYDTLVTEGEHSWGTHMFRPFSSTVKKLGVEADFMIGLREVLARNNVAPGLTAEVVAGFQQPVRRNEVDGVVLVATGRTLSARIIEKFGVRKVPKPFCRAAYNLVLEKIAARGFDDPKYNGLTPERFAHLREVFRDSNDVVAQKLWGKPWAEVFPAPDPARLISTDLDEAPNPVLSDHYDRLVRECWRELRGQSDVQSLRNARHRV